ncbi:hypothetical protein ABB37_03705 [Leptomonas pyrrhocoris]|uniref:Uncharacterized protein n=1 Tax=Leptomonas pyrrhocoris TaxID=157538 RepID=A0A0M9G2W0_LEPPY|nr:hypothetical protein ABB37_03705 [Leptomonas pyrrhocoris]KPA81300.1 hypothetical protein ABB37_03705 [Leptomonas pyrrhocoris]|eukprot:XP_015659739.1 hypothetical protein ABB37_03705 [Leptomonas pyrrhocoris]
MKEFRPERRRSKPPCSRSSLFSTLCVFPCVSLLLFKWSLSILKSFCVVGASVTSACVRAMNAVPQQYYDTCAQVRQYLQQTPPQQQPALQSQAHSFSSMLSPYRVLTTPDSPANVEFVRTNFPAPSDTKSSSTVTDVREASAHGDPTAVGWEELNLEERYAQLLRRIEDGTPGL